MAALDAGLAAGAAPVAASEQVTITRDSRGEPHIQGASARGAMYGFAWAQMEDQAPYILAGMAHSVGRSAELMGSDCQPNPSADPDLEACFRQDQLARLFMVPETASIGWRGLSASDRARLQGFADGINAYIASGAADVPSWAVPVTPQDVLANVEYGFLMSQVAEVSGILGGAVGASARAARTARTLAASAPSLDIRASNMFALRSTKTATGKPILQGDPHLPFDGVSRWYAAQLSYPGNRVQGVTFRGLPGIALGSNGYVAW